MFKDLEFPL